MNDIVGCIMITESKKRSKQKKGIENSEVEFKKKKNGKKEKKKASTYI